MPKSGKRPWQRFDHVRKPACFRKRQTFGRDKKYLHIPSFEAPNVLKASPAVKNGTGNKSEQLRADKPLLTLLDAGNLAGAKQKGV
jgi:hypothetical protein